MDPSIFHNEAYFPARDGTRLYAQSLIPREPRAEVGFIHGYGDHSNRYRELFDRLAAAGFATHALDYRGHGRAQGRRGYVWRFEEYIGDVEVFVERIRAQAADRRLFLIGHSHGGLVLARTLQSGMRPPAGLVFASPYVGLAMEPSRLKIWSALALGRVLPWMPVPSGITPAHLTRDRAWQEASEADPHLRPLATPRWFTQSNQAQELALLQAPSIAAPSLVLLPEEDPIAAPAAGRAFFDALGGIDKNLIEYPGARHELFHEVEETRELVFTDLEQWLLARS